MLSKVRWGEFKIDDVFNIDSSKGIYHAVNIDIFDDRIEGSYPYVVRTSKNNGVRGYTIQNINTLNPKNTISFAQDTSEMFFQKEDYFTGNKIKIMSLKDKSIILNDKKSMFLISIMNYGFNSFVWGSSFDTSLLKLVKISLPIKNDNSIDFDFMDTFISELEAYHISELEAYLLVTGLKNYNLNKDELCAVERIHNNEIKWKEVRIVDRFKVKNTSNILSEEISENSGDTPYLGATSQNNGILSYISYDEKYKDDGECVFIGGKTFVVTYQENDFYSNDSHNLVLYYNDIVQKNKLNNLFFCTSIKKSLGHKYSWGNSISKSKIQSDYMMLPVDDKDDVDYDFMKHLISAVQKLVIKDVVLFSDEKIKATKQVVNNKVKGNKIIKDTIFDKKLAAHIDVSRLIDKLDSNKGS